MRNTLNPQEKMKSAIKVNVSESVLIVGYPKILQASEEARGELFSGPKGDPVDKFEDNPLLFYSLLSSCFTMHCVEAVDMIRSKTRIRSTSPKRKPKI